MKAFITPIGVLLFLCGFKIGIAQDLTQTIKGKIVDQQSKTPVIGATVLIKDSDPLLGGVTDVDGYYRIANVPIGRQTLVFSSIGYDPKVIPNVTVGSGKEVVMDLELIESLIQMEAVEIIANRQEKGTPENELATVSAISLSVEETSRYAASFDDPARAALSQAGVTTGGDDLLNEIVIRGNSPKGILWRLEGVEIPNPNHFGNVGSSAGGISMLSNSMLANSDFFTGAFPSQYGNATSGIFDLKLRNGNFDTNESSFQAGILGIAASSEGPLSKNSNASYLFNYRYSTLALFDNLGIKVLGNQESVAFQDLSFKFNLPTKKIGKFSIWGLGGDNTYTFKPDQKYGQYVYESDDQGLGVVGITHITYLGERTYLESVISQSGSSIIFKSDSLKQQVLETERTRESSLRISSYLNHKFDARNTLRVGVIVSRLHFNLKNDEWISEESRFKTYLDDDGAAYYYQFFSQWQHRFSETLTLNTGLHTSYFGLNNDLYVEPRIGFRWQATTKNAFTGGFGLHSRMETLSMYMAQAELPAGGTIQYNKNMGFTKAAHAVIGFERMIKSDLRLKAETYFQYLYEVPVWGDKMSTVPYEKAFSMLNTYEGYTNAPLSNTGVGRNYGLEVTVEKFFSSNYYFMTNGSLYRSTYEGMDGVEHSTIFDGNYIFNVIGGKEFKLGRDGRRTLGVNARLIYAGGKREAPILLQDSREMGYTVRDFDRNYTVKLGDYKRLDLGINYKKNKEKSSSVIAINIQNVFAIANEYGRYYSSYSDQVISEEQLGFFPNLSYKVEF